VSEPKYLANTMNERIRLLFANITSIYQVFGDTMGLCLPVYTGEERTLQFANSIHPANIFEYLGLHLYVETEKDILLPHVDRFNCDSDTRSNSLTLWETVHLTELQSQCTIVLVATFRKSVSDYMKRSNLLAEATSQLLNLYRAKEARRRNVIPATLYAGPTFEARPLHYNPMVHASVLVHWVTRIPLHLLHQEKIVELAVAFFRTNNPIRFHEYMCTIRSTRSAWRANLYFGFLRHAVGKYEWFLVARHYATKQHVMGLSCRPLFTYHSNVSWMRYKTQMPPPQVMQLSHGLPTSVLYLM
jgi:hypothetical protein